MPTFATLGELQRDAKFFLIDADAEAIYVWYGGHGIHTYDGEGREVDLHNVGDFSQNEATLAEVKAAVKRLVAERS